MIEMARGSGDIRQELFRETASKMTVHEAIIEKDFWVCLTLFMLFTSEQWKNKLIFKGGTSLSKVYSLIERFSEDIDLILDWRELGLSVDDPWKPDSNTQRDRFVKETNPKTTDYLRDVFIPEFGKELNDRVGPLLKMSIEGDAVKLVYPKAFSNPSILPHIILEIGPLAGWTPHETQSVTSYGAQYFPKSFSIVNADVRVVMAARTFWEKATILHQEYNRPEYKSIPKRYSRHYYDVFRMVQSPVFTTALEQMSLLEQVVDFKNRFYRCPWAGLNDAKHGSFHLVPPEYRYTELKDDYKKMSSMFFSEPPGFELMMGTLSNMEKLI